MSAPTPGLKRLLKNLKSNHQQRVTPLVDAYLLDHGHIVVDQNTPEMEALVRMVSTPQRDRSQSFSASGLGRCARERIFAYIGVPERKTLNVTQQNLFNDGTWRHLRWQMMLLQSGAVDRVEPTYHLQGHNFRGSLDGQQRQEYGVEVKGTSNFTKAVNDGVFPLHRRQIHGYMLLSGLPEFSVIYEDKRTQQYIEHIMPRDEAMIMEVLDEITYWEGHVAVEALPPIQPECANGSGDTFNYCPYRHVCLTTREWPEAEALRASGGGGA